MNKKAKRLEIYRERGLSKQKDILFPANVGVTVTQRNLRTLGLSLQSDFSRKNERLSGESACSVFVRFFVEKRWRKTLKGSSYFLINFGLIDAIK